MAGVPHVDAAIKLFAILLKDLSKLAPQYATDLRQRLNHGIAVGEGYLEDDPSSDGPALIPGLPGDEPEMMDLSATQLLEDQLFPEREAEDSRDLQQTTRAMVIVAFYAALESYAAAFGVTKSGTALPTALEEFLARQSPRAELDPVTAERVREFHETRVLIVHNKSIVNDRYVRNVTNTALHTGEIRYLALEDLVVCATAVWNTAKVLASVTHRAA